MSVVSLNAHVATSTLDIAMGSLDSHFLNYQNGLYKDKFHLWASFLQ